MTIEEIVTYFSAKPGVTEMQTAGKRVIFLYNEEQINIFLRPKLMVLRLHETVDYEYDPNEPNVLNYIWDKIITDEPDTV